MHIGIKWMGLAAHLKRGQNVHLYRQKLDKNGYLALTQGLVIGLEFKVNPLLAIRLNQALIPSDCAGKFLGVTQLGLSLWQSFDHSRQYVGATLGPVWFYRHAWTALPQYRDDGLFELKGNTRQWQTKFVWHGLDLGYRLALHDRGGFELNCMPGLPEVCTFSPGAYWQAL
ncbi:MAG: hypothetical protein HYZ16_11905 [Bacteroidetes bacterium]|nr:hypothetical protein [Bacteroidota bacterium]